MTIAPNKSDIDLISILNMSVLDTQMFSDGLVLLEISSDFHSAFAQEK